MIAITSRGGGGSCVWVGKWGGGNYRMKYGELARMACGGKRGEADGGSDSEIAKRLWSRRGGDFAEISRRFRGDHAEITRRFIDSAVEADTRAALPSLFRVSLPSRSSESLFRAALPSRSFGSLFRVSLPSLSSEPLFRASLPSLSSESLFRVPLART